MRFYDLDIISQVVALTRPFSGCHGCAALSSFLLVSPFLLKQYRRVLLEGFPLPLHRKIPFFNCLCYILHLYSFL